MRLAVALDLCDLVERFPLVALGDIGLVEGNAVPLRPNMMPFDRLPLCGIARMSPPVVAS